jgi:hypothetical protein
MTCIFVCFRRLILTKTSFDWETQWGKRSCCFLAFLFKLFFGEWGALHGSKDASVTSIYLLLCVSVVVSPLVLLRFFICIAVLRRSRSYPTFVSRTFTDWTWKSKLQILSFFDKAAGRRLWMIPGWVHTFSFFCRVSWSNDTLEQRILAKWRKQVKERRRRSYFQIGFSWLNQAAF